MEAEIRVRPVVRYVVTRYSCSPEDAASQGRHPASCETLGEFDSEKYAEQIAEAMRGTLPKPMQYAIVERSFDVDVKAYYAEERDQAEAYKAQLEEHYGKEFRIYEREVTDPSVIGRMAMTPAGTWAPLVFAEPQA